MYQYPKQILTVAQQVQSYIDAGMVITSRADVEKALRSVGFIACEDTHSNYMIMLQKSMFWEQSLKMF